MIKRQARLLALLIAISVLMTGCWDSREVNMLNLASMVILDKHGSEYAFTAEIALISSGKSSEGGGSQTKQEYVKGTGFSLVEARDNLDLQMDLPLYLGTVRAVVLTERAAENDLAEYLFRLRQNQTYRQKVYLVITEDDPEILAQFKSETNQPAGFVIDDTLTTAESIGHTFATSSEDIVNNILANRSFVLQHISLVDKQIKLTGYSVFNSGKLVGFIPTQGTQGLTYFLASKPMWRYRLPAGEMNYTVKVELSSRKIMPFFQDGKISFDAQFAFHAVIEYQSNPSMFPVNEQVKSELVDSLNTVLGQQLLDTVTQSQSQFKADYLQLGEAFRIAHPDAFEQINWQTEYQNAEITISTSVDISVSEKMNIEAKSSGG